MVGSIILVVLGIFILIGLGNQALKDFNIPSIAAVILLALIVGLNFIPPITTAFVTFRIGSLLLYLLCAMMFFVKGKWSNRLLTLLITLILAGLVYGSTRLAFAVRQRFLGTGECVLRVNSRLPCHAVYEERKVFLYLKRAGHIDSIAFNADRRSNGFGRSFQLGGGSGQHGGGNAYACYQINAFRPNRMSYYFEAGRMLDE